MRNDVQQSAMSGGKRYYVQSPFASPDTVRAVPTCATSGSICGITRMTSASTALSG
nr:hypothetical protein [Verrucomicrobium spinosum]